MSATTNDGAAAAGGRDDTTKKTKDDGWRLHSIEPMRVIFDLASSIYMSRLAVGRWGSFTHPHVRKRTSARSTGVE